MTNVEQTAAIGAQLTSVKILKTQPDVVQLVLEVPGTFRHQALELGNYVGAYFGGVIFMDPQREDDEPTP
jgi:hypothetical protein